MAEYHVENFGCRASRADGEAIAANLRQSGLSPADTPASANIVIVNTCSVTAEADRQARSWIRRARRQNPQTRIIVTGCYAQRAPEELAALPEVDAVIGNSHKSLVAGLASQLATESVTPSDEPDAHSSRALSEKKSVILRQGRAATAVEGSAVALESPTFIPLSRILHDDAFAHSELATLSFAFDAQQTRPNLKVQDGCANRCSFCIIPTTRGPSRSIPLQICIDNVQRFVDNDGKESARGGGVELVLSGINLGRWGRDLQPTQRFEDLVAAILTQTSLPRLRLSSIEPMDWSQDLLALYREFAVEPEASSSLRFRSSSDAATATLNAERRTLNAGVPRLCRHTHLPLQSGSDTILRRMYRRYRPWHYAEKLAAIRKLLPDAAIGADVMIGFPGESDALFKESYDFIAAQPFTYLHLFPFSARPGTPAWELHRQNPVPARAVHERMAALRTLIEEKSRAFRTRFIGRTLSAVTLSRESEPDLQPACSADSTRAVTDNFLKLTLFSEAGMEIPANHLVKARITALTPDGLSGILSATS